MFSVNLRYFDSRLSRPWRLYIVEFPIHPSVCGELWAQDCRVLTLNEEGSERDWGAHSTTLYLERLYCQGLGMPSSSAFTGEAQESEKGVCFGRCPEQ